VEKVRVIIADDHPLVREGFCHVLEDQPDLECVGIAKDGKEAIKLVKELLPDVAIIDIVMPEINGIDAAREIRRISPNTRVLIVTAFRFSHDIVACIAAGVRGYLLKDTAGGELCNAIRMVHAGKQVFDAQATDEIFRAKVDDKHGPDSSHLSAREVEVLALVAKGMSNKEIANTLCLSHHTVNSHFVSVFRKLGVESRTEAVLSALRLGIISMNESPEIS